MACDSGSTNTWLLAPRTRCRRFKYRPIIQPPEATAKVGVDNIKVEASAENVMELSDVE